MKQAGKNTYSFSDTGLLINGVPIDFDAIVEAARQGVLYSLILNSNPVVKNETYKRALFGSLGPADKKSLPGVYSVEKLKEQLSTLQKDLYLKAQLGLLALDFKETISLFWQLGHKEIYLNLERAPGVNYTSKRLMVGTGSPHAVSFDPKTGQKIERLTKVLASSMMSPSYPRNIKEMTSALYYGLITEMPDFSGNFDSAVGMNVDLVIATDFSSVHLKMDNPSKQPTLFGSDDGVLNINVDSFFEKCASKYPEFHERAQNELNQESSVAGKSATKSYKAFSNGIV